jgi:hypothetical protein
MRLAVQFLAHGRAGRHCSNPDICSAENLAGGPATVHINQILQREVALDVTKGGLAIDAYNGSPEPSHGYYPAGRQ